MQQYIYKSIVLYTLSRSSMQKMRPKIRSLDATASLSLSQSFRWTYHLIVSVTCSSYDLKAWSSRSRSVGVASNLPGMVPNAIFNSLALSLDLD